MGDVLCSFETQIYHGNSAGPVASMYRRESEGIFLLTALHWSLSQKKRERKRRSKR